MSDSSYLHTFGTYRLGKALGRGSMGTVYLAYDEATHREVAIKQMLPNLATDYLFRARFERECEIAARMRSPYVIPIHKFGRISDTLYIDMQYVDAPDLAGVLRGHGSLPPARAVRLVAKIARCLEQARRLNLIHRDVKPSNILVSEGDGDHPYLLDFGLAKILDAEDIALTSVGSPVGTPAYMAPEGLRGAWDHRSDIYSLACVFYECLVGSRPFVGPTVAEVARAHRDGEIPMPSSHDPALAPFDSVILLGLAKDPEDRAQTSLEFSGAMISGMQEYAKTVGEKFDSEGLADPLDDEARPWRRRAILGGIAAIVSVGAVPLVRHEYLRGLADNSSHAGAQGRVPTTRTQRVDSKSGIVDLKAFDNQSLYICTAGVTAPGAQSAEAEFLIIDVKTGISRQVSPGKPNPAVVPGNFVSTAAFARLYVSGWGVVQAVEKASGFVSQSVAVPGAGVLCLSEDEQQIFVAGDSSRGPGEGPAVYILETATLTVQKIIEVPGNVILQIAAGVGDGKLYVATNQQGNANVWIIELGLERVANGIALGPDNYPWGMVVGPEGDKLYVAGTQLTTIGTEEMIILGKFDPKTPLFSGIVISASRKAAYLAGEKVVSWDLDRSVVSVLDVPAPSDKGYTLLAMLPDESKLYVVNEDALVTVEF